MHLVITLKFYMESHKSPSFFPYLSSIYLSICDIFFDIIEYDIASYANDNTAYNFDFSLDNAISNLEKSISKLSSKLG